MAGDRRRVANASVILPVRPAETAYPEQARPARLDEASRQLEVPSLAGRAEQLDERHLDLRVTIDPRPAGGSELALDRVGRAGRHAEQPVVAKRALPGDRGLDEVAEGVQLVAPGEVPVLAARRDHLDVAVEIAVGPLGALDERDRLVRLASQRG